MKLLFDFRFQVIALLALCLLFACGCSTVLYNFLSKYPDGESCLTATSPDGTKTIKACLTKETFDTPEPEAKPEELEGNEGADVLYCFVQDPAPELLPVISQDGTNTIERLVGNLGFPIFVCLILIYFQWRFFSSLEKKMTAIQQSLQEFVTALRSKFLQ